MCAAKLSLAAISAQDNWAIAQLCAAERAFHRIPGNSGRIDAKLNEIQF